MGKVDLHRKIEMPFGTARVISSVDFATKVQHACLQDVLVYAVIYEYICSADSHHHSPGSISSVRTWFYQMFRETDVLKV